LKFLSVISQKKDPIKTYRNQFKPSIRIMNKYDLKSESLPDSAKHDYVRTLLDQVSFFFLNLFKKVFFE
jgi:hypothetical protein